MVSHESADGQSSKSGAPILVVDAMLGKLARWLRFAGYDAEFWREGSDEQLMAAARQAGRLIVTKDRALAGRRGIRALLIHADDLDSQIAEARSALTQLGPAPLPFTRCAECNGELVELPHADAEDLVPPYVWHTQTQFWRCARCRRIYWKGTHWPPVQDRLGHLPAPGDAVQTKKARETFETLQGRCTGRVGAGTCQPDPLRRHSPTFCGDPVRR